MPCHQSPAHLTPNSSTPPPGSRRAGKWRSIEVFLPGRRNCSLSHFRMGSASESGLQVRVAEIPAELSATERRALAAACKRLYFGYSLGLHAVPEIIEAHPTSRTFCGVMSIHNVHARLIDEWLEADAMAMFGLRRYIVADWAPRNIARPPSQVDWRKLLEFAGPEEAEEDTGDGEGWQFVLFGSDLLDYAIVQWDPESGIICIASGGYHRVMTDRRSGVMPFLAHALSRIDADRRGMRSRPPPPPIAHVTFAVSLGAKKAMTSLGHFGFVPLKQYLVCHPDLDTAVFDRVQRGFGHEADSQFGVVVARVRDVFASLESHGDDR
ncbi:hypothetical protein BDK51DRAFT_46059 [Blyttiomyces helicus]|uniref:Uncharacterized protein n=1 Tax=Blyttiomyces helicus TaxID=388810 RepID=A0A4P9VW58_9FUNG|nr:hypothetical protein BDK51DRAFT_46059 [Blyttiomyces helicus]|eukprot:RKO83085.1 hypothetical protein BDK51DRAFT_46059 [Blyttiomyces helicus]